MRRLIWIPIVHTSADLGRLSEPVRDYYLKTFGPEGWNQRERAVARLWDAIREKLRELDLDYRAARIYQDGLPVCGLEQEIVRELAQVGSSNHQLILELLDKGATLMGTEDPQLLIREYQMHQRHTAKERPPDQDSREEAARLLAARDEFIEKRIDETLQAGETGLLFLGAAHGRDMLRSTDIRVESLF
jgi:hypothetical protein